MGKPAYKGAYFAILLDEHGVEYVTTGDSALIVPLTPQGAVIMNEEPAPAFDNQAALVLPGGEIDPGETALRAANRELQEEIGYSAGQLDFLGEIRPFARYLQSRQFVYLARDLRPSRLPGDEQYIITSQELPLAEIEKWVADGRLRDAGSITALFLARSFMNSPETI